MLVVNGGLVKKLKIVQKWSRLYGSVTIWALRDLASSLTIGLAIGRAKFLGDNIAIDFFG